MLRASELKKVLKIKHACGIPFEHNRSDSTKPRTGIVDEGYPNGRCTATVWHKITKSIGRCKRDAKRGGWCVWHDPRRLEAIKEAERALATGGEA